jgi:hypothetical protein
LFLICSPVVANGQTVTAMWEANPPADQVTSYQVCVGTSSMSCSLQLASVSSGETSHLFTPTGGVLHFVAVRAVNAAGAGAYSTEATFSIPSLAQPVNQSSQVGVAIAGLNLSANDPDGSTLTYTHTGLPTGLTLNGSTGRITGTPSAAGTHNVTIFVTDSLVTVSRSFTWTITNPSADTQAPVLTITSHANGQTLTSSSVTLAGTATDSGRGGNDIASVMVNGQAATGGTATGSATANWSRALTLSPGANTITVQATDNQGNVASQSITLTYTIAPVTSVTLTANLASPQNAGTAVTFTASAAGGVGPRQYKFLAQQGSGAAQVVRDWSSTATHTWTPTTAASYTVSVWARSAGVTADAAQASAQLAYVINTAPVPPVTSATLTSSLASPQNTGTAVTFTANAAGGVGPRQYKFLVQPGSGAAQMVRDWSTTATYTWTPSTAASYTVTVWARSAGVTTDAAQASAQLAFVINTAPVPPVTSATLTSNVASPQNTGTAVTFSAGATGGVGPQQYKFLVQQGSGAVQMVQDWSTTATYTWTPATAANYTVSVWARSAGVTADVSQASAQMSYVVQTLSVGGPISSSGVQTTHVVDVNGDGRADVLTQDLDNRFWLSLMTTSGYSTPVEVLRHGGAYNPDGAHVADVNGDGRADILFQGFDNSFWLSLSTGTGYTAPTHVLQHGGAFNAEGVHIADVSGDGRADVLMQGFDNVFWLSLSTGTGYTSPTRVLEHNGPFNPDGAHVADVNGDGRADVLMQTHGNSFWLSLSTGTGYTSPTKVLQHGGAFNPDGAHVADVNGDGRADILFQGFDNSFWLSLSTGTGYTAPTHVLQHGGAFNPGGAHLADLNGDGRDDVLMQGFDNSFWLSLSTGTGYTAPVHVLQHGGEFNPDGLHLADVNQDGTADVLLQGFDNSFWLSLSTGTGCMAPVRVL